MKILDIITETKQVKAKDPVKKAKGIQKSHPYKGKLVGEADEPKADKSARAKLDHSLRAQGHKVEKDRKKELKKGKVKHKGRIEESEVTMGNFGGVIYPRLPHEEVLDAISSWEYGDTPIELSNGYVINAREEGYNADDNTWVLLDPQGKMVDHGEGSIVDVMQDFTPIAIEEGKSPHKKGTKKYKKHMAAMHAGLNEGPLVLNRDSDLRGMLDTLLKGWLSQGDHSDDEYAELLKALGYRMKKDGQRTTLVKEENLEEAPGDIRKGLAAIALIAGLWGVNNHMAQKAYDASPQLQKLTAYLEVAKDHNDQRMIDQLEKRIENHKMRISIGKGEVMGKDGEPIDVVYDKDVDEAKQRLDPKCWKGYKKQGTKMKGGVRVNNCVPK